MSTEYFVYIWTNIRNGKKYIGSHKGNINDGYIGSGIYFKRAYNKEPKNFKREILEIYESYKDMKQGEHEYLLKYSAMENENFYNLTNLSSGGNLHAHLSKEQKEKICKKANNASMIRLANMSEQEKRELKIKKQQWVS